ncbi:MAG: hypothetical protein NW201_11470, partial [Gemmatimonadales bacterium]|nr:hypothetical protein [Gemmatimonadales bacterium]
MLSFVVPAVACLAPVRAPAQDAPVRAAMASLVAALDGAGAADAARLRDAWRAAHDGRAERRLGEAWASLRLAELDGGPGPLGDARRALDDLARDHPDWPWARFGLARAALLTYRAGHAVPVNYGPRPGGVHFEAYADLMHALLRREPGFAPARDFLLGAMADEWELEQPA